MTLDEIRLAFRMIAQGRPHQEMGEKLAEALAVVLANPEERLALTVADEPIPAVESGQTANAPVMDKPRRGRPPKHRVSDGENDGAGATPVS